MKLLATVVLMAVLLFGVAAYSLSQPFAGFSDSVFVDIPRGTGAVQISGMLARAGVIRFRWQFLAARAFRPRVTLHAGEYRFREPATAMEA